MARERSRSPFAASYEEIISLVVSREQARSAKDWTLADSIREKLSGMGVSLQDKSNTWRSNDGQTGRIPTWSEIEAGHTPESIMAAQEMRASGMSTSDGTEPHIKRLVQMREQARAQKDWAQSDKLREELRALGVDIFDKEKIWRSRTGASGVIIGYRGAGGPTDLEISTLMVQREKARQLGDFATSDMIRDELKTAGVHIQDREKTWRCSDGRQGTIPSWADVQGGGGAAAAVPAATMGAAAHGAQASLQNQLVQAALAAAQSPAAAMRTLQLLQSAPGGAVAPAAPVAKAPRVPAAVPTTSSNPECQEALTYIQQCQAAGQTVLDAEIEQLVALREKFRQNKDFTAADELRTAMRTALSVEFHENEKRWSAPGGRQGVIPMWS
mmetsp:Transcript_108379/g.324108  ORF Transcript_108379/g.324108 Transcript_108379/m.324108 type:complete len:385 (+) Transcript_108379:62-1216(+)